jgi:hypothetical protein
MKMWTKQRDTIKEQTHYFIETLEEVQQQRSYADILNYDY